ncbi:MULTISPECIES: LysR family transcriptional regulator [Enterobacteriaceae]|uniref:LysR family transcriptional regulator n=1 Tax=Enterobacteriaceae TaxID=543 RepID=UPI0015DCF33D|nr:MULTISPECIES: LysR family transcriptional regulator [unclassified Klebsiella]HAT3952407.1 LysR family transcriptional regulator [Kluyvera ascorbata]BBR59780.1 LysR family transcriptional regulator [Klebsiella sp. WP4-W18-ESBL-05]BBS90884.1 LysR family transcriptional regulator [Klebsiella sp. WP7-S18-CRE-02]BBS95907.1 LysR family transcriptional regulator [Klebsiella sp. WP7-S18-CRE-03]BBT00937.1 LysR family transcriptional regulator [Klebsiella sp. WP7-S18-ESBL-04]
MHRSGLTELEIVLAVTRQQSFRAAARELGMSATAVSNAVAGLESRLNVRLFNRTTRSVALTEQGQRYVARIAPALAEIQRAAEEIAAEPGNPTGTLRINAPRECVSLLFQLFDTYLQRYPQMRLDITTESRLIDIVSEGFDAGIRLAESVPQDMIAVALTPDARMLIVGSPDYFKRHGTPVSPDDLQQHQSIGMRMSHGGVYHWELERHQQKFTVNIPARITVSEMQAIHRAALAGLGLAFISEWFIQDELHSGKLISVLDEWCPTFGGLRLYYPGHRHVLPALRAFVELAHELNARQTLPR